jgi:antirestriction protein ArdC
MRPRQYNGEPLGLTGMTRQQTLELEREKWRRIDQFIAGTGAKIQEQRTRDDSCRYTRRIDEITMLPFEDFRGPAEYYSTVFHELAHWTAHPRRLNRQSSSRFETCEGRTSALRVADALEEMTAELAAAFLCDEFSIDDHAGHASYIQKQLKLLQNDSKAIVTAALNARAAVDYLRKIVSATPAIATAKAAEDGQLSLF